MTPEPGKCYVTRCNVVGLTSQDERNVVFVALRPGTVVLVLGYCAAATSFCRVLLSSGRVVVVGRSWWDVAQCNGTKCFSDEF